MQILSTPDMVRLNDNQVLYPYSRYVTIEEEVHALTGMKELRFKTSTINCYERRYGGQDANYKRLLIVRMCGIGDLLMTTALPKYIKYLYPDAVIHAASSKHYSSSVWKGNQYLNIRSAIPLPMPLDAFKAYDYHLIMDGTLEGNREPDQGNAYEDMFAMFGMTNVPKEFMRPNLADNDADLEWWEARNMGEYGDYFVYVAHASSPVRDYPMDRGAEAIRTILDRHQGLKCIVLSEKPMPEVDNDERVYVTGHLSDWRHMIPIIKNAKCVVTPDSGAGHVAACFPEVPVVSLWGSFAYGMRASTYPNHKPLQAGLCRHAPCCVHSPVIPQTMCKIGGAWKDGLTTCADLAAIEPGQIADAVESVL